MNFDSGTESANVIDSFLSKSVALTPGSASFPGSQNHLIIALMQWQYWWWFWFSMIVVLYYSFSTRLVSNRLGYQNPKIVTSYKSHGRWGDLIICLIPIFWCINILSSSHFLLRALEWQTETSPFTLRVRGKQWYWVYKFDLNNATHIDDLPKLIGYDKKVFFQKTTTSRHERVLKTNRFKYFTDSRQSAALEKSNTFMNRDKNFYQNKLECMLRHSKYLQVVHLFDQNSFKTPKKYFKNTNYSHFESIRFYSQKIKACSNAISTYLKYKNAHICNETVATSNVRTLSGYVNSFESSKDLYSKIMGRTLIQTKIDATEGKALSSFLRKAIIDKYTFYRLSRISAIWQEYHNYPNMGPSSCKNKPHNLVIKVLNRLAKLGIYKIRRTNIPLQYNINKLMLTYRQDRLLNVSLFRVADALSYYKDSTKRSKIILNLVKYALVKNKNLFQTNLIKYTLRKLKDGQLLVNRGLHYRNLLSNDMTSKALPILNSTSIDLSGMELAQAKDYIKCVRTGQLNLKSSQIRSNMVKHIFDARDRIANHDRVSDTINALAKISKISTKVRFTKAIAKVDRMIQKHGPLNPLRRKIINSLHHYSHVQKMIEIETPGSFLRNQIAMNGSLLFYLPDTRSGDFFMKRHSWYYIKNKSNYSKTADYLYKLTMDHAIVLDHYKKMYKIHITNWHIFDNNIMNPNHKRPANTTYLWAHHSRRFIPIQWGTFKKLLTLQATNTGSYLNSPSYVQLALDTKMYDNTIFQKNYWRVSHKRFLKLVYDEIQGRYVQPVYFMVDDKIPNKYWKPMTFSLRNFCLMRDKLPRILPSSRVIGSINNIFQKGGIINKGWLSENIVHSYYRSIFVYKKDIYLFRSVPWNESNLYQLNSNRNWRHCQFWLDLSRNPADDGSMPELYRTFGRKLRILRSYFAHWMIHTRANGSTKRIANSLKAIRSRLVRNEPIVIGKNDEKLFNLFKRHRGSMSYKLEKSRGGLHTAKESIKLLNLMSSEIRALPMLKILHKLNDSYMRSLMKPNPNIFNNIDYLYGERYKFTKRLDRINNGILGFIHTKSIRKTRLFIESLIKQYKYAEPAVRILTKGCRSVARKTWFKDRFAFRSLIKTLDKIGIYHYQFLKKEKRRTPDIQASCWVYFEKSRKIKDEFAGHYNKTSCFVPLMLKKFGKLDLTKLNNSRVVSMSSLLPYENVQSISHSICNRHAVSKFVKQINMELAVLHRKENLLKYLSAYSSNKKQKLWFDSVMYVRVKQPALWLIRYFFCTHRNTTRTNLSKIFRLAFIKLDLGQKKFLSASEKLDKFDIFANLPKLDETYIRDAIRNSLVSFIANDATRIIKKKIRLTKKTFDFDINIVKKTVNSLRDFNRWTKSTENYKGPIVLVKNSTKSDRPLGIRFSKNTRILRNSEDNTNLTIKQKKVEKTIFSSKLNQREINYSVGGNQNSNLRVINGTLAITPGYFEEHQYDFKEHNRLYNEKDNMSRLNKSYPYQKRLLWVSKQILLPTHTAITIITNSYDVIHSWFIPGLGLKMDCVPGRSTHHTIYVEHTGYYYGQCAEVCGRRHHHMPIKLLAVPLPHFVYWWKKNIQPHIL